MLWAWLALADVVIGMAGPITGENAWFGEQMERGAAMAVAEINASGGALGHQVHLTTPALEPWPALGPDPPMSGQRFRNRFPAS